MDHLLSLPLLYEHMLLSSPCYFPLMMEDICLTTVLASLGKENATQRLKLFYSLNVSQEQEEVFLYFKITVTYTNTRKGLSRETVCPNEHFPFSLMDVIKGETTHLAKQRTSLLKSEFNSSDFQRPWGGRKRTFCF